MNTGILGRAFVEKLLRSTNVKTIFILLRPKHGSHVKDRLESFKNGPIFNRLWKENPSAFERIVPISGNIVEPMLGISTEDMGRIQNVSIFFHAAASVKFDDSLEKAIHTNVGGTYESIKVAAELKDIKLFVYISTFYVNLHIEIQDNEVHEAPMDWRMALKIVRSNIPKDMLLLRLPGSVWEFSQILILLPRI